MTYAYSASQTYSKNFHTDFDEYVLFAYIQSCSPTTDRLKANRLRRHKFPTQTK